jgi:uncharacterized membrane protein (DUF373 family)
MGLVLLFSTVELSIYIIKVLFISTREPGLLLEKEELLKLFGLFFNVIISLELFETVRLYLKDDILHAEYVLLVGITAVTRKVIILDYEQYSPQYLLIVSLLIGILSLGYFLVKKSQIPSKQNNS